MSLTTWCFIFIVQMLDSHALAIKNTGKKHQRYRNWMVHRRKSLTDWNLEAVAFPKGRGRKGKGEKTEVRN